jgi:hypothetical protein
VVRERPAQLHGERRERAGFLVEQVPEEPGGAAHGLTGIVQNVVESRQALEEKAGEDVDARRMPQVEPVDLQAFTERREIGLLRVAVRGVHGKSSGDDDVRTGPQQFERCLKADLYPSTRHQSNVARQIGRLLALGVVELAARVAEGIVIAVHPCERLLANVASALLAKLGSLDQVLGPRPLEPQGRVRGRAPLHAQSGRRDYLPIMRLGRLPFAASESLRHPRQFVPLRLGHEARERQ